MNKKAQFEVARKTIYWMIAGFVISIVIIAFAFIIVGYRSKLTSIPPELNAEFISLRFANIPECFAYQDAETGRVYPGTIELDKFTEEQLDKCYKTEPEKGYQDFNFQLELFAAQKSIHTNNYYNVAHFTLRRKVLVHVGDKFLSDELLIYTQVEIPYRPSYIK